MSKVNLALTSLFINEKANPNLRATVVQINLKQSVCDTNFTNNHGDLITYSCSGLPLILVLKKKSFHQNNNSGRTFSSFCNDHQN